MWRRSNQNSKTWPQFLQLNWRSKIVSHQAIEWRSLHCMCGRGPMTSTSQSAGQSLDKRRTRDPNFFSWTEEAGLFHTKAELYEYNYIQWWSLQCMWETRNSSFANVQDDLLIWGVPENHNNQKLGDTSHLDQLLLLIHSHFHHRQRVDAIQHWICQTQTIPVHRLP